MAERFNLGKVLVTLEGEHDSTRSYDKYCEVSSGGSSYVSKKAVPIGTPITDTTYWQKRASKGADGIDGTDGDDGLDAYQPFKGWYSSTSELNTSFGSPQVGDYAYIKGATANDPVSIYQCTTAGTWTDSGRTFNPSNNQEFASGESLNTTHIVDNLNSTSPTDVLSAKQGKELKGQIDALGHKIDNALYDISTTLVTLESSDNWNDESKYYSGGGTINKDGTLESGSSNNTCLIPVGDGITFTAYTPNNTERVAYCLYDNTKNVIGWVRGETPQENEEYTVTPQEASYVRWCAGATHNAEKYYSISKTEKYAKKEEIADLPNKVNKSDIVNDTTTGGAAKVLSAEAGKKMAEDLSAASDKIGDVYDEIFVDVSTPATPLEESEDWDDVGKYYSAKSVINKDGTRESANYTYATCIVPISTGIRFNAYTPSNEDRVAYILYDESMNVISWFRDETTGVTKSYVVMPTDGAAYIRWCAQSIGSVSNYEILSKQSRVHSSKPQYDGIVGKDGLIVDVPSFGDSDSYTFSNYPSYNLWGDKLNIICKVTTFSKLIIYRGISTFGCKRIEIDNTNIKTYTSGNVNQETYAHGLTISSYLSININWLDNGQMMVKMNTLNGSMMDGSDNHHIFTQWGYATGQLVVESDGCTLANLRMSLTNSFFRSPFWIFGASQESMGSVYWLGQLKAMGYGNLLANALAGRSSDGILLDLRKALNFGCPKYLYFGLSNDGYTYDTYKARMDAAKECADEYGITIIFVCKSVTPNETSGTQEQQLTKRNTVINYGCRYWDFGKAVSQDPEDPTTIYAGYLDSDYVHPVTPVAGLALAIGFCADVPEVMQYAKE